MKKKENKKNNPVSLTISRMSSGCFLGFHNWNGGKKCVKCGKKR